MKFFDLLHDIDEGGRYPDAWISSGNIWTVGDKEPHGWYVVVKIPLLGVMKQYDFYSNQYKEGKRTVIFGMSQYFLPKYMDFPEQQLFGSIYPR